MDQNIPPPAQAPSAARIMLSVNAAWNIANFRTGLIQGLQRAGHEVISVAPDDQAAQSVRQLCTYVPLVMDKQGMRPDRDLMLMWRYWRLMRQVKPDVYLGYTVKPNVYGSLAAHALGVPVINNIAGLGAVFIQDGWLVKLVRQLYRFALRRSATVFFQNDDDRCLFVEFGMVRPEVAHLLPGSGIDLQKFAMRPPSCRSGASMRFLLVARMLWDKGVGEYVEAARALRNAYPDLEFALLGFVDVENPAAISRTQVEAWVSEGVVTYLGVTDDVRPYIASADCVVLPSYREGTPRTLLEAAAMGRPLITTDAVGCREVVDDGDNGFLCEVRSASSLAEAMQRMIQLSASERAAMGQRGRAKMAREFDEALVVKAYLTEIERALAQRRLSRSCP
jgi:glycosyltransferase involved in cell wall biosynthesis